VETRISVWETEVMSEGDVHTLPHKAGWANKIEGSRRVANTALKKPGARRRAGRVATMRRQTTSQAAPAAPDAARPAAAARRDARQDRRNAEFG
jgi:hypothetical protein